MEPGAGVANVNQIVAIVDAQQKRTEPRFGAGVRFVSPPTDPSYRSVLLLLLKKYAHCSKCRFSS